MDLKDLEKEIKVLDEEEKKFKHGLFFIFAVVCLIGFFMFDHFIAGAKPKSKPKVEIEFVDPIPSFKVQPETNNSLFKMFEEIYCSRNEYAKDLVKSFKIRGENINCEAW